MEQQLVVFELANESYGIQIAAVESIIKMQAITQLPRTPAYIRGVTNLRGSVLPVIDLRSRFGLGAQDSTPQTRIIIVTMNDMKVGMVVDGVSEVLRVSEQTIEPPSPFVSTVNSAFIKGIARVKASDGAAAQTERLIILLDLEHVLSAPEQEALLSA